MSQGLILRDVIPFGPERMVPMTAPERAKWLARRRQGVGASDAPVIMGLSKWQTPYELWHEKMGLFEVPMNEAMFWGIVHEASIAAVYAHRTGQKVYTPAEFITHPLRPWQFANIDRITDTKTVEIKAMASFEGWGPDGSSQIPDAVFCQVTHQMDVAGVDECDVAALLGGTNLRIYTVRLDPQLATMIAEKEEAFWQTVLLRKPPPIDWKHPSTVDFVIASNKAEPAKEITVDCKEAPEVGWAMTYLGAIEQEKQTEEGKREVKAKLIHAMGDAAVMRLPNGARVVRGTGERASFRVYPPRQ